MAEKFDGVVDDIGIADVIRYLLANRFLIVGITLLAALASLVLAFASQVTYRASVVFAIESDFESDVAQSITSKIGGLASLAGVDIGGSSDVGVGNIATLKSRVLSEKFIEEFQLENAMINASGSLLSFSEDPEPGSAESRWFAFKYFDQKVRHVQEGQDAGLWVLSVEWETASEAAGWANGLLETADRYLREQAIIEARKSLLFLQDQLQQTSSVELRDSVYELVEKQMTKAMLAQARENYAFRVIDPAQTPIEKHSPKRGQILIIGLFLGFLMGVSIVVIRGLIRHAEG